MNKEIAGRLSQTLDKLLAGDAACEEGRLPAGETGKGKGSAGNINAMMELLLNHLLKYEENNKMRMDSMEKEIADLKQNSRIQSDLTDEVRQRGLKGNLVLTSPNSKDKSIIKSMEQLDKEKKDITSHAVELIKLKYDVTIPAQDIQACHFLPSKSNKKTLSTAIFIRIWNRCANSAWSTLKNKILSGEGKNSLNLYVNFQLTPRRSSLAYHLRKLKKECKIVKFFTDENGYLSFKKDMSSKKIRVTFNKKDKNSAPTTLLTEELLNIFLK